MKKEVVKKTLRLTREDAELLGQKAQIMNLNEKLIPFLFIVTLSAYNIN